MLKKRLKLPQAKGSFSFLVDFKEPLPAKGVLFVIRPNGADRIPDANSRSSLTWSKTARGFFLYNKEILSSQTVISQKFELDLQTNEVEIEVFPWGQKNIESMVSRIELISTPSSTDSKYTTFIGESHD